MNKPVTILIVDDDSTNLQVLGNLLKDCQYHIALANNGNVALEILMTNEVDLILLDVMMPEMDGFELCRIIKSRPELAQIPILYLSALNDVDKMVQGFKYGAVDYLTKPFNAKILLSRVQTHLDLYRKSQELEEINRTLELKVVERTLELSKANQELSKLDALKSEFLNIISHELRTPLNGIMGASYFLKGEHKGIDPAKIIEMLDTSVTRLEKFTMNALLITELRTGIYSLNKSWFTLEDLINSIIALFQKELEKKYIQVHTYIQGNIALHAELKLIEKCITSLIDNAIRFSPPESKIDITVKDTDNGIICEIRDYGEGFSTKALSNLFQAFTPGNTFYDQNEGLELAICKYIMDVHEGELTVNNESNGANVILFFNKTELR
jgi:two-component system sensor histidine kinase/response regulator